MAVATLGDPRNGVLAHLLESRRKIHRLTFFFLFAIFLSHDSFSWRSLSLLLSSPIRSPNIPYARVSVRKKKFYTAKQNPIIVIDNYDSFTYNLCQYIGELGANFEVHRNDELTVEEIKEKNPRAVLISPGPGTPHDSGISREIVLTLGPSIPVFGVGMGMQWMGEAFGGKIIRSPFGVMHGKSSLVYYDEKGEDGIFARLPNPFVAGRYDSHVIEKESLPSDELEITAWTEDGLIMGVRHKKYRHIQGVQFHPESIITIAGTTIVLNFVNMVERLGTASH